MSRLAVAFVVQGEGRGHMTQALALAGFLRAAGHEVVRAFVGESPFRSVPDYFRNAIGAPLETFAAPTQVPDRATRSVSATRTALDALRRLPEFVAAGKRIHRATESVDVVVNFLDLVGGISRVVFRTRTPAVAVAHNYVFLHRDLADAPGAPLGRRAVLSYARATAGRADTKVALSYGPLPADRAGRLLVAPPLLRPEVERLAPRDGGHLLAYALNAGYGDLLAAWQRRRPDVEVHCYLDGGAAALRAAPGPGFHAHPLAADAFLEHLASCRAYVGSAGFESVCEAFAMGKPALVVPTEGQLEQVLNAWDARRAGAAVWGSYADLDTFWDRPSVPPEAAVREFREWVRSAPEVLVGAVESAARTGRGGA
ncbi:MAG: glycosyltransferase family protein [Gemmatimonadales bacterium]